MSTCSYRAQTQECSGTQHVYKSTKPVQCSNPFLFKCHYCVLFMLLFVFCVHHPLHYLSTTYKCYVLPHLLPFLGGGKKSSGRVKGNAANTTNQHRLVCMKQPKLARYKLACGSRPTVHCISEMPSM